MFDFSQALRIHKERNSTNIGKPTKNNKSYKKEWALILLKHIGEDNKYAIRYVILYLIGGTIWL